MKVSTDFLTAKKDKNITAIVVISRTETDGIHRTYIRLCLDVPVKYTEKKEMVFVETPTEIKIDNYSGSYLSSMKTKVDISTICFHLPIYNENYVKTFLMQIKKDSEVTFKIVAFNSSDMLNELSLVSHQLYGTIDGKEYFLNSYVGHNNTASPVQ